ncbi:MAG: ComEC/Rec2 family competence protein, partial [Ruminococcus sp.]|nr:ComEC/Rec2 family competence protein [Ruminococcus sp.]
MAATAIIACVVNIGYTTLVYDKTVEKYSGQTAVVKAQLKGEPINYYGSYCYNFKALKVDDTECNFKFYGYNADLLNIEPYDIVTFEAQLSQSDSSSKISKGYFISALMDVETLKVNQDESEKKPVLYYASVLREIIRENFTMLLDDETTQLCSAIFIGDKYALSETINQDFMRAGVTHLVVVSGLHFSIIVWMLFKLAEKYGKLRKVVGAFSILLILSYMFLVGFSPSVVRSAIMLIIYSVGMMISAQPYSYNSLAFAGLCIVLPDPFSAGDVSLILSFATTFSIITFTPKIYYYFSNTIINRIAPAKKKKEKSLKYSLYSAYRGFVKAAFQLLSANIGAVIASIPLSIMFFDSISTVSVLATFIISPIISVVLILSIVICLLSFVPYT